MNLYITADTVGKANHGGGSVTANESAALAELGPCEVWDRGVLQDGMGTEPWCWDERAGRKRDFTEVSDKLAHVYAGTFSYTVHRLKKRGVKVSYTAAAHDVDASRKAHEELGIDYAAQYPHMVDSQQWDRYLGGYKEADVLVVPSKLSERAMRSFGCTNRIEVVPHGVEMPPADKLGPRPTDFRVGYLGSYGPDKGVIDLMRAWKKLNYPDATLVLAGQQSRHPLVLEFLRHFGGGRVALHGWVDNVTDFYNNVSVYCQPSRSEGWGLEVTEAMAHERAVICSDGAGAADAVRGDGVINGGVVYPAGDVDALAAAIDDYKKGTIRIPAEDGREGRLLTKLYYTWPDVRERYKAVWKGLLDG